MNNRTAENNGLEMGQKFLFNTLTALDFVADSVKQDNRYQEVLNDLTKCNSVIDSLKLDAGAN